MSTRPPNDEERFALFRIFHEDEAMRGFLERCLPSARVTREDTGVGFFATLRFDEELPDTAWLQWDWNFVHDALEHGGSFMCWRDDSRTLTLEAVAMVEDWPSPFRASAFRES